MSWPQRMILQWTWEHSRLLGTLLSFPSEKHPEAGRLHPMVVPFFCFLRNLHAVFRGGCSSAPSGCGFLLHILTDTVISCLLDDSHSHRCEVISHCGFSLHFADD